MSMLSTLPFSLSICPTPAPCLVELGPLPASPPPAAAPVVLAAKMSWTLAVR